MDVSVFAVLAAVASAYVVWIWFFAHSPANCVGMVWDWVLRQNDPLKTESCSFGVEAGQAKLTNSRIRIVYRIFADGDSSEEVIEVRVGLASFSAVYEHDAMIAFFFRGHRSDIARNIQLQAQLRQIVGAVRTALSDEPAYARLRSIGEESP